jgi:hypothetical protein
LVGASIPVAGRNRAGTAEGTAFFLTEIALATPVRYGLSVIPPLAPTPNFEFDSVWFFLKKSHSQKTESNPTFSGDDFA